MWWLPLLFTNFVNAQTCRVLAQEGGASFGSYESGAFQGLVNLLPPEEVQYNVAVGISAGSLNSLLLSIFPIGQEQQAASLMHEVYANLNGSQSVYVDWKGGVIEGLTFRSGLYNNEPLRKTIAKYFTTLKRNITVGTCNLDNGGFVNYNETTGNTNIQQAAICSSSIPGFFPVQHWDNANYVDGGTIYMNDIGEAVRRCYLIVGDYSKITVDMLSCFNRELNVTKSDLKSFEVRDRVTEIKSYDKGLQNLYEAITAFPTVNFRYYIQPSVSLGLIPLNFTYTALENNYQQGLKDAATLFNNKIYARQIIDEWIATNKGVIVGDFKKKIIITN